MKTKQETCSMEVAAGLHLVQVKPAGELVRVNLISPTNHVLVIDCSGSMCGDLPALRAHVKQKLPKLLKDNDTLSIVWFSGRGQFGALLEGERVGSLTDLAEVNRQVDRWLRPIGLTGFKEPIEEVERLVSRVAKKNPNPFSLFFMSDGCDNQWRREEIVKAVEKSAGVLGAATVVEYGYYADRPLLTQMAEKWGGTLIFSENFAKFSPALDAAVQRTVAGKKVEVAIKGDTIGGFAFSLADGEINTYAVEGGKAAVPEGVAELFYLSPVPVGVSTGVFSNGALYAAVSLFAVRMKPEVVLPLLKKSGDVAFIDAFAKCFGKQAYSAFQDATKAAAFDPSKRLTQGYDPTRVPPEDAFTVLEFLELLQSDDDNRVLLGHSAFDYKRIGRGRVDASSKLTDEEQAELQDLSTKLAATKKRAEVKAIKERIEALTNKPEPLKFVESGDGSYPVRDLTFNEDRCNVSIQVKKQGKVDLPADGRAPGAFSTFSFPTFCFRNYAIIKDGIVNVDRLPVQLTAATWDKIHEAMNAGRLPTSAVDADGIVSLSALPVINRKMVKATSARDLFEKTWELTKTRAAQKVLNSLKKEREVKKASDGFVQKYGQEATEWLKEQGITEYGGFAPKSVQAESTDFYLAKLLEVKVKGYSTIPSLNDYRKQLAKNKLNPPALLMKATVEAAEQAAQHPAGNILYDAWLDLKSGEATSRARRLIYDVARTKFAVIVGQTWFSEFKSLDEHEMDLSLDGERLHFSAELREVEEKI